MFYDIIKRIKFLFSEKRELYLLFYNILGFYPSNIDLYVEAMAHRSAMKRDANGKLIDNERLEFLGDSVLDSVVAHILYNKFPKQKEGFLTSTRSKIVQREHLNKVGLSLGLDSIIKCSSIMPSHNSYVCGNALEALVGAIYLDRGYEAAYDFILRKVIDKSLESFASVEVNYKSKIIEWVQRNKTTIDFELISTSMESDTNSPVFRSAVVIGGVYVCEAEGYTKKESHQIASKKALKMLAHDADLRNKILLNEQ